MPKQVDIAPDVGEILARGHWPEPTVYSLPAGQLDRKTYEQCNAVLAALGGRWDRKVRGHRFPPAGRADLDAALAAGVAVDQKRTMEQFFTSPDLAARLIGMAGIEPGHDVLEPSAGDGALIRTVLASHPGVGLVGVELDTRLYSGLIGEFGQRGVVLICANFLSMPAIPAFDRVVMNPPFSRGADMAHVCHALATLRPGGRLAAIMSPHWTFASDQAAVDFRALIGGLDAKWTPLPDGSFRAAGTGVNTGILIISKGAN